MSDILEVFEEQKQLRLDKFLGNQLRLQDEKERHFLFLSYDHTEDEEHLYEFWRDTVNDLLGKVFKRTYVTPEEIVKCFNIKGQKPFGLMSILQEMKLRKEFINPQELTDEVGWISQKLSALSSWFGPSENELQPGEKLISVTWLENVWSSIVTWAFKQENQTFHKEQIEGILYQNGRDKDDVKLVIANLIKTDRMLIEEDYAKIGYRGEVGEFTNSEKASLRLNHASQELLDRINITKSKISKIREEAKNALKIKNRDLATNLVKEKKALEKIETILCGQRMKIDKQVLDIQMTLATKDTLEVLKLSNDQQSIIDDDLGDAQELMDAISDKSYNLEKINEMFTTDDTEEEMDEDLLKELMNEPEDIEYPVEEKQELYNLLNDPEEEKKELDNLLNNPDEEKQEIDNLLNDPESENILEEHVSPDKEFEKA